MKNSLIDSWISHTADSQSDWKDPRQFQNGCNKFDYYFTDICPNDWTYFEGYCYRKVSSCDSWNGSQGKCSVLGANLPSIHNQEENVYVQNLHGGEHSWLGLTDINSEGTFVWSDGTSFNFHYWASHQPNNFKNEDCVHTLGFLRGHEYKWNDVNCSDCHKFTCKKGTPLTM